MKPENLSEDLRRFAAGALVRIYETHDFENVRSHLAAQDPGFLTVTPDDFGRESLAGRLALCCLVWETCCFENHFDKDNTLRIFLKCAMDSFRSSKFLSLAETFGDYLHGRPSETDLSPAVKIAGHLFRRLKLEPVQKKGGESGRLNPAFALLVEVFEGIRASFENEFQNFSDSRKFPEPRQKPSS